MRLLDPTYIRDHVDYSFGDESGMEIPGGYMKPANSSNQEFIQRYWDCVNTGKSFMALFIDNIRLYRRDCIRYTAVEQVRPDWKGFKDQKIQRLVGEDLLTLLSTLPNMKFIIFTGFEDTPIDEGIWGKIPNNVLGIYASNCMVYGGKVQPIPYGLQRRLSLIDNRQDVLYQMIADKTTPKKLMYINFNTGNNPIRAGLHNLFINKSWVTVDNPPSHGGIAESIYRQYLVNIKQHKFMLCPSGNAQGCECHRDWETIYMKRVPIVLRSAYLELIFENIPVLFVDSFDDITEQLLIDNDHLYQQMRNFDLNRLDIEKLYKNIIANFDKYGTAKELCQDTYLQ